LNDLNQLIYAYFHLKACNEESGILSVVFRRMFLNPALISRRFEMDTVQIIITGKSSFVCLRTTLILFLSQENSDFWLCACECLSSQCMDEIFLFDALRHLRCTVIVACAAVFDPDFLLQKHLAQLLHGINL
jgi:hypothetical protein